jgi:SAM-dependent methyltransferase
MFDEAMAYERFMGRWSRRLAPLLVAFAGVREGETVLDVGSGTGSLAHAVTGMVASARVIGVEPALPLAGYARAHAPTPRVQFVAGTMQHLPCASATVDRVLSLLVMNFVPDPDAALREMVRVTRPGGVVAAAVWDYGGRMQMLRLFWDEVVAANPAERPRDERHMPLCRQGELGALWRAQGLTAVEEQALSVIVRFESFDDFWRPFLGGQGPAGAYVRGVAATARGALERRLRQRVLADGPDGAFTLTARAWGVRGVVRQ